MAEGYDVAIVGGGHNGLVAAALLAKRGLRVVLLERRDVVGGAAITETPFGPEFKVTALSYVVSLMPPTVLRELELERHGYKIYPQHGYFAPAADGPPLRLPEDPARRHAAVAALSPKDAEALVEWDAWLGRLGAAVGPLLGNVPPRLGSHRPRDLWAQMRLAWRLRGLGEEGVADLTRLMTMSVADLLEERFESARLRGVLAVSGIIGTWAGPRAPGTAYVMAHHKIGDVGDGQIGAWGFPEGGMGGLTEAMRRAAVACGATVRTEAPVARIDVEDGVARGVVLEDGEEIAARAVISTVHPRIAFGRLVERSALPDDFAAAIDRWKSRSGTVKINLALDRLPAFRGVDGFDPEVHGGTIVLAESIEDLEGAFQDAASGRAARRPFADICIPSVVDPTLAPEGKHVMSLFTQWVPCEWAEGEDAAELSAYADRVIARVEDVAPGFTSSILHRQVIGPETMERRYGLVGGNIFHGELSAGQIFHMRPAPGFADHRTPVRRLYQAGSATHGGGGVTAIPALQVARRVARDL